MYCLEVKELRWAWIISFVSRRLQFKIFYLTVKGGKEPLGRPRRRWVDNIRMDFQEVGCGYMDWIGLAHDRDR